MKILLKGLLFIVFIGTIGVDQLQAGKVFTRTIDHTKRHSTSNISASVDVPRLYVARNLTVEDEITKVVVTISISPAVISVNPHVSGSFEVMIESGVTPIGAYDIDLSWTAGVFTIDSVAAGGSSEFGMPIANINNNNGKLTLTGFQFSSLNHPFGTFSVATINYTSGQSGTSVIDLSVQELSDTNGVVLTTNSVGGSFELISGELPTLTPTPSPTATTTWTATETQTATPSSTLQATPTRTLQPLPTAVNPESDLDGDGKIGPGDLLLLLSDWGRITGNN